MGIIIPTDFHIFQDGWNHQPVGVQFQRMWVIIVIIPIEDAEAGMYRIIHGFVKGVFLFTFPMGNTPFGESIAKLFLIFSGDPSTTISQHLWCEHKGF